MLSVDEETSDAPRDYLMVQTYPNPFNGSVAIEFELAQNEQVKIDITTVNGQLIKTLENDYLVAGRHQVFWNPQNIGTGIYFYRITAGITNPASWFFWNNDNK